MKLFAFLFLEYQQYVTNLAIAIDSIFMVFVGGGHSPSIQLSMGSDYTLTIIIIIVVKCAIMIDSIYKCTILTTSIAIFTTVGLSYISYPATGMTIITIYRLTMIVIWI